MIPTFGTNDILSRNRDSRNVDAPSSGGFEGKSDLERYTQRMYGVRPRSLSSRGDWPHCILPRRSLLSWLGFPFASVSVLVILTTLFAMSMERGGWTWSSWTYAFAFFIMIPLVLVEFKRRAVITGAAIMLLFFMVLIDAGMPGMFGYNPSDLNWYDNLAHFLGALVLTWFLWAFICWAVSPTGPPRTNGRRKFWLTVVTMALVSLIFEFMEFFTDAIFGWTNFHPGIDTAGDLIFDFAGILTAAVVISRHRVSPIRRPFWHAESVTG